MRLRLFALGFGALLVPGVAVAEGTLQPEYPPGFDCSAVPAGSQRQACYRSHLDPPMGPLPRTRDATPTGVSLPDPKPARPPTAKPPTIPRLPGTIEYGN